MKKLVILLVMFAVFFTAAFTQEPIIQLPSGQDNLVPGIIGVGGTGYWAPGKFKSFLGLDICGTKFRDIVASVKNGVIYVANLTTKSCKYLVAGQDPWLCADGKSLVYIKNHRLWIYSNGQTQKISDLYASEPCWRAGWISFVSTGTSNWAGVGNGPNQVWVIKPNGTGARMVYKCPSPDGYISGYPQITFDGKSVIVDGQIMVNLENGEVRRIILSSSPMLGLFILLRDSKGTFILYEGANKEFFKRYI